MLLTWKSLYCLRCDISSFCLLLPPSFPYSLPLSYPLSSAEPIFWHFRRCSSHACHLSPPPPTLSSQLSIESMRLCLKLMYFVELTLWRLHHLEVGKWYWTERLVFKERRALKHSVLVWHGELKNITPKNEGGKWLFHLYTCTSLQLSTADCEEGGRLGTYVSPWCKKPYILLCPASLSVLVYSFCSHLHPFMYEANTKCIFFRTIITLNCPLKDCEQTVARVKKSHQEICAKCGILALLKYSD